MVFTRSFVIFVVINITAMNYALYMRVSTEKQGRSGLGLIGQKNAFIGAGISGKEFIEVKSGRGKYRPVLAEAIEYCKATDATLVVAKLDRLARDVVFLFQIRSAGIKIKALDVPELNTLTIGIFATMAQYEHEIMCARQKSAMDAKLARDGQWRISQLSDEARMRGAQTRRQNAALNDNNRRAVGFIKLALQQNYSYNQIAIKLHDAGYLTSQGCRFTAVQVRRLALKLNDKSVSVN